MTYRKLKQLKMEISTKQLIELVKTAKRETKGSKPRTPSQLVKAFENSINEGEPSQRALHENKEVCDHYDNPSMWKTVKVTQCKVCDEYLD